MSYDDRPPYEYEYEEDAPTRSRSGRPRQQNGPYVPLEPPKKRHPVRNWSLFAAGAVVVFIIVGALAAGGHDTSGNTAATAQSPSAAQSSAPAAEDSATAESGYTSIPLYPQPNDPATSAAGAGAGPDLEQVVFHCAGSAPDGVEITYGGEGTEDSASRLPFTKTIPLSASEQYYAVQAQLQGGGKVSCSTTVEYEGTSAVQKGEASGGYTIASAEVCSDFEGGWESC
ncbi:hypothetical protein [Actinospica robiniae]|uniref:hypothetical protein n=1 Tax=Actinospica robiniae TaxID=304901 RepID=UPI000407CB1B|nr:hypothetical protein [Actinospica robiniae]